MFKKIAIPVGILVVAVFIAKGLMALKTEPPKKPKTVATPLVEIQQIDKSSVQFSVRSQGTVAAKRSIQLVSEVSGRILWVSPNFVQGGVVKKGELLLKIDPVDYQVAVANAKATLADEILDLAEENARVNQAAEDWAVISKEKASDLTLRKPQLAKAEASVVAAREKLRQAKEDLERTQIKAPFNAVIDGKSVDLGQFISMGKNVAQLLGTDVAEIRLPVTATELSFVRPLLINRELGNRELGNREFGNKELGDETKSPKVRFTSDVVNHGHFWEGNIARMEARMDPDTRVFYLTAEVLDPYGLITKKIPLNVGMFVEASISGVTVDNAVRIPRGTIHDTRYVFVVDGDKRLKRRKVEIIRSESESVVIGNGLNQDDRLVLTRLDLMVDGMPVSLNDDSGNGSDAIDSTSLASNGIASDISSADSADKAVGETEAEN